ncbi:MAG: 4Fe-4S dicluster domain-containing protein [Caldilineaceae bacterium]|nr:4Fe-4S dicluster domain-containing protein [Caldilineaceae bacterium]
MSRRAFLARLRPGQSCAAGDNPIKDWLERGVPVPARLPQQVPASRRHLLEVLRAMGIEKTATVSTGRTPFGSVNADSVCCSACALCARFCPTGALRFDDHADEYTLSFQPAACLNCGICVAVCPEGAVSLDATVHLADVIQDVASPLATGKLTTCPDCGAVISPLAGESDSRCHICRQGAGVVTSLRDGPGLMADLLKRVAPHSDLPS